MIIQLFLLANAFILGIVSVLAYRHAQAHFRPEPRPRPRDTSHNGHLPPEMKARLVRMAETNFTGIINQSGLQLKTDLSGTRMQLNKLLEKFGSEVLEDEMKLFRTTVAELRSQTEATLGDSQNDVIKKQIELLDTIAKRQTEFENDITEKQDEIVSQLKVTNQHQVDQFKVQLDNKLSDAVTTFLLDTLGHEVDLGSQADYLVAQLELHKAELIRGVTDES